MDAAQLERVLDAVPGLVGYWDASLRNVYANQAYRDFFAITTDRLAGRHIADLIGEAAYAANLPHMRGALAGHAQRFDRTLSDSGGRPRQLQVTYIPDRVEGVVRGIFSFVLDVTARKEQEEALIAERGRLRDAEAIGLLGSWEMDVSDRSMTFSTGFLALYGLDPGAFGVDFREVLDCVVVDDRAELHEAVESCIEAGLPMFVRYRVIRADDDELRWMECRAQASHHDGRTARLMGVVADITDRVTAEHEAAHRHATQLASARLGQQYQVLLTTVVEGVVLQDNAGVILQSNPAAGAILGLSTDDLTGLTSMDDRWQAIDAAGEPLPGERHPAMVALREGVAVRDVTFGISKPGGNLSWIKVSSAPLFDADGQVEGVISGFADVTAQRHAELALADSQQRFRLAFETAPIGMAIVDLSPACCGQLLGPNPAMLALTGWSAWALRTVELASLFRAQDEQVIRAALQRLRTGEDRTAVSEALVVRADGGTVWCQVTMSAVPASEGKSAHAICLMEDISLRKQAEERLTHHSLHDPLTGLANRRLLQDRIQHALAASLRSRLPIGVLYVDLDGFKQVNDSAGHTAGDDLLADVAQRLAHAVRPGDTVARIGGDEFAILAVDLTDVSSLRVVATRCLDALRLPFDLPGGTYSVSASIGMQLSTELSNPDQLLNDADIAMYEAKRGGKDRVAPGLSA